ncbi:hypothetical protein [Herbaspirillum seropedicae]|uniref:hypothetical protein n=1 Tax=Herbaspirillum seropedicae TaxID=964 RepID=UPI00285751E3|nr:hypothetical protein [Herbaspirillum seropedicae]MDR6395215.1 hypothetical protein [Herbaspirillum seropedicae]
MPSPIVVLLDSWPIPSSSSEVTLLATETKLCLRYFTPKDEIALIQFPLVNSFRFGSPNDEALGGHPLAQFGLKRYSVHRIENSSWLAELDRRNAVHPNHDSSRFMADLVHYVFTFQDSTLECAVREGEFGAPTIKIFLSGEEAKSDWAALVKTTFQ